MASFSVANVSLQGIAAAVPVDIKANKTNQFFPSLEVEKFVESTGVEQFRVSSKDTCTSDLCFAAATKLLEALDWNKDEIDILIFVSQTPDYYLPITAAILQDRLKLSTKCLAFDMILGCSGFVYGMSSIAAYMATGKFRKGLLLCGDTPSKMVNPKDKSSAMLFGDAGTAAAFEYKEGYEPIHFSLGTDGSGYKAIIINDGGFRNPINENTLKEVEHEAGLVRRGCDLTLEGMDVFSFGISQAPKSIKEICTYANVNVGDMDFLVFHQANMMMNEMVRKKLKLGPEKVPNSLKEFGNTSSASIPITMATAIRHQLQSGTNKLLLCGFGVGLSWGSAYLETANLVIPDLIEV